MFFDASKFSSRTKILQWCFIKNIVQDMLDYVLIPCTCKEAPVMAYTGHLHKQHLPGMYKIIFIGLLTISVLVHVFYSQLGSQTCSPTHIKSYRQQRQWLTDASSFSTTIILVKTYAPQTVLCYYSHQPQYNGSQNHLNSFLLDSS